MSTGTTAPPPYDGAGKRRAVKPPSWMARRRAWCKRHKIWTSVIAVLLTGGIVVGGYALYLYLLVGDIHHRPDLEDYANRPDPAPGDALNILLLGEDKEGDVHRSDTIMIAHIPEDRSKVYLVSIPRDSYVEIYDDHGEPVGSNKINAAFSDYGERGTQATVEQLTGVQMNTFAIIDMDGFEEMSEAVGGVEVYVPEKFTDTSQNITWEKGWQNVEGQRAVQYVRTRYGLTEGDFGRIARQQNFMRALLGKMVSGGTLGNPVKLADTLKAVTSNLEFGESFGRGEVQDLAFNMTGIRSDDVEYVQAPFGEYANNDAGSVVLLDEAKSTELFGALKTGEIDQYLQKYPGEGLPAPKQVE